MMESLAPIHVISLPRSGRRDAIAALLSDRGVEFHIEDAVDGRLLTHSELTAVYDDAAARRRYGRSLTSAEVACFMSHRSVWRKVVDTGRAAVILEDDAILEPVFFERVLHADESELSAVADIVLLGRSKLRRAASSWTYFNEPLRWRASVGGLRVGVPFKQWTSGSVGYWISAHAARRALAYSDGPLGTLLDDWPWHRDEGGARVAELRPYAVWEDFERLSSSIEQERKARIKPRSSLHIAALWPLRLLRTTVRWSLVALQRLSSGSDVVRARHE
ncbi:glycosyltransferase family 25 protein [Paraburkholderia sp. BL25I1N1]|uniref:glycosyltransferase family 25 protein n=1 Tax=Paraburkholderia sp. BL25I1N1 TaxID=1938804 RepID=UPI000D049911|nr:glycosyltransferase family 25 protein [Paraburkholderia sp. BL25I1N1]PRY05228.1 glycosyl transferase family 25 [Paraburkholderia sp. BL25I1N1]